VWNPDCRPSREARARFIPPPAATATLRPLLDTGQNHFVMWYETSANVSRASRQHSLTSRN
jgi:hypothetical protein